MKITNVLGRDDGQRSFNIVHLLTGPTVVWFVLFLLVPLTFIIIYSFLTYSSYSVVFEFTFTPWTDYVFEMQAYQVFVRTLLIGLIVTVITLIFGYPLAYYLRFYTSKGGGILLLLFLVIPFWTSGVLRTIGWLPILGKAGIINKTLLWTGLIESPIRWLLFSPFSQLVGYLQNYIVFMTAPIYISLAQIDSDLIEASETLRAGPAATFRNVIWPLSLPGVVIGSSFVFVLSIGNFTIPQFLSGGQGTITTLIFFLVNSNLNYPAASALSLALLLVIFLVIYSLLRAVNISDIIRV